MPNTPKKPSVRLEENAGATLGLDRGARLWERRDYRHARMSVRLRVLHDSADVSAPDAVPAGGRSRGGNPDHAGARPHFLGRQHWSKSSLREGTLRGHRAIETVVDQPVY